MKTAAAIFITMQIAGLIGQYATGKPEPFIYCVCLGAFGMAFRAMLKEILEKIK